MKIINRSGSGGSGGGGEYIPEVGDIKLTSKRTVIDKYVTLEQDRIFHKDSEPLLHSEYFTAAGDFQEIESFNDISANQKIYKIHEYNNGDNLYITFLNGKTYIFKDFQDRTDIAECPFVFSDGIDYAGSDTYISSTYNECLIYRDAYSKNFFKVTMDYTLTTTADIVASHVIETFDYFDTYGLNYKTTALYGTRAGIAVIQSVNTWSDVKIIPWDLNKANVIQYDLSGIPFISSDPSDEKMISYNGGILSRGVVYGFDGFAKATIAANNDHRYNFSVLSVNGVDVISIVSYNAIAYKYILMYENGTTEVKNYTTPIANGCILSYADENNFLYGYYGAPTGSSNKVLSTYKNGVFIDTIDRKLPQMIKQCVGNQFTKPFLITLDLASLGTAILTNFITEVPDIFTIQEEIPTSTDKVYQIKTENGVEHV